MDTSQEVVELVAGVVNEPERQVPDDGGLDLATVTSSDDESQLRAAVGGADAWIGANDRTSEGAWVWDGTGQAVSYDNWDSGEPNDGINPTDNQQPAPHEQATKKAAKMEGTTVKKQA